MGLSLALTLLTPVVAVGATPDFSFTGSGWGHGVGLSQYGAKAMGADGATYQEIINRYFTMVAVGPPSTVAADTFIATDSSPLWVGLLQNSDRVSFRVDAGSARLCFDRSSGCVIVATVGENWRFGPNGTGGCAFWKESGSGIWSILDSSSDCEASVRPSDTATTFTVPFKARQYSDGILRFRKAPVTGKLHTVLEIGIDGYMRGLAVLPESWAPAALQAQVVVSRSKALWHVLDRGSEDTFGVERREECYCNLYDGSPDQVFQGFTGELRHPNWVAAVSSTAQQVMGYGGTVALGEFGSSSGGMTEAFADVVGGDSHPYLVTVNDSAAFSVSAANPHGYWGAGADQASLAAAFNFSWVSNVKVLERHSSGSAATVLLSGIRDGRPTSETRTAVAVRSALSLRSTTFDITVNPRFADVPATHQFAGEVLGLNVLRITTGCTATTFCPTGHVTRGEMAAFLARALGLATVDGGDSFTDDDDSYFEADIEALLAAGITNGCTETSFCPGKVVTRGEMAAFIVRGFTLDPSSGDSFADDNDSFFEADIEALAAAGVTSGCTDTGFCPGAPVTREQMAAFLVRALAID
jgi:SpoIID/LytB domain protein